MLIGYEELKKHFGGNTIAELVIKLKQNRIPYLIGKGSKPVTTETAINAAMGISSINTLDTQPKPASDVDFKVL